MTEPFTIVLATRNRGKVEEMRALLGHLPIRLLSAGDLPGAPEVEEDQQTLAGNAAVKARALRAFTGRPALADDTGLEVDALGGRPGVYSARYAGPASDDAANRARLLAELDGQADRSARFRTVIAFAEGASVQYFEGVCEGRIALQEHGAGGFGYDAVFVPGSDTRTFAEMPADEKNAVSHRGQALRWFEAYLRDRFAERV
jgi:XTP/dITP diphosphohydrolase